MSRIAHALTAAALVALALTGCTTPHSSPVQAEPTPTATREAAYVPEDTAPTAVGAPIERCLSDDYNDGSQALCYTVRVTDGAVLIIDATDTVVSAGPDEEAPAPGPVVEPRDDYTVTVPAPAVEAPAPAPAEEAPVEEPAPFVYVAPDHGVPASPSCTGGELMAEDGSCVPADYYGTPVEPMTPACTGGELLAEDGSCVNADYYRTTAAPVTPLTVEEAPVEATPAPVVEPVTAAPVEAAPVAPAVDAPVEAAPVVELEAAPVAP